MQKIKELQKPSKILKTKESIIQKQIINFLLKAGYLVVRMNGGSVFVDNRYIRNYTIQNNGKSAGLPDLLVFKNNRCLMFEVKNEIGKLLDSQKDFMKLANYHKFDMIYTVRNYEEVLKIINDLEKIN